MASIFNNSPYARLKRAIRRSPLTHVVRPTRLFFIGCKDFVLDQVAKVGPGVSRRVLMASFPKAGTHLMIGTLMRLRGLNRWPLALPNCDPVETFREPLAGMARNRFGVWHYGANDETLALAQELDLRVIVMLRDPRDIVVSFVDYVTHLDAHVLHGYYRSLPDFKERARRAILGVPDEVRRRDSAVAWIAKNNPTYPGISDLGACCRAFLGWTRHPHTLFVKYEDLVGEKGGGSRERQRKTMSRIAEFIGIEYTAAELAGLCEKVYNPKSRTFNKGVSGRWREKFDDELKGLFKQTASRELVEMGYEQDDRW